MQVLVAYGTKNGSTAGIAEVIGDALRAEGFAVRVQRAGDVRAVRDIDAVVLGGAVYANRWHRDAGLFARRYARALAGRPVWLFSSGPLNDSADHKEIPPAPGAAVAARLLQARGHVTFGGSLTEEAKGFIARSMVRNGHGGDFRNPTRVRAWAREVAEVLHGARSTGT